ncbi:DUF4145 domain-containing protein [Allosphingosinicella deserti]|uniref:DUF4145 domain-containing protein n=1 Tax=Allosphingosinicella deserti TaxID=2116704 RepID=A0A2P7QF00_9SPHN|nr:hypothetical protein [Sphingomonas deserti]PSJ36558.1 hypothetical protein C7I55_26195 [Sphingomonas deserti]
MNQPKRQTVFKKLRSLTGARPDAKSSFELWTFPLFNLSAEPRDPGRDREIALVCASVLEQALEVALLTRFPGVTNELERQLFSDSGAPLGSLSSKITLARALGIIGERAKGDLNAVRSVRNAFAHSRLALTFETPEISAACELIDLHHRWPELSASNRRNDARETFIECCFEFTLHLTMFGDEKAERLTKVVLDVDR